MSPPRTLSTVLGITLALAPRGALALDSEPNDSCTTGESLSLTASGEGDLASGTDVDVFRFFAPHSGMLRVELHNQSNVSDDFVLLATDADTSAVLDSDSSDLGFAVLDLPLDEEATVCIEVAGSEGAYNLSASFVVDPPVLTEIVDELGLSISEASRGDTVWLVGQRLAESAGGSTVLFGEAMASVVSASETELEIIIPANAVDGEVRVMVIGQESNALLFEVGESEPESASSYSAPDAAWFSGLSANPVYLNRTLVSFRRDLDRAGVEAVLDDVVSGLTSWSDWTIVGALPMLNAFQVEWTASDPLNTPVLDDLTEAIGALTLEDAVTSVSAEGRITSHSGLTIPGDYDLLYANNGHTGAMAQISLEEARRLLRFSELSSLPADPGMVIFDTGLYLGSGWLGSTPIEFPSRTFQLWEYSPATGWGATAAPGHASTLLSGTNHGNQTASIVGGASQGEPDWLDGAARSLPNMAGIWASMDLFGINDDADDESGAGVMTDEPGESIAHEIVVVNNYTVAGSDTSGIENSSTLFMFALAGTTHNAALRGQPLVIPLGLNVGAAYLADVDNPSTPTINESKLNRDLRVLVKSSCERNPWVVSAGNDRQVYTNVNQLDSITQWAKKACPKTTLVVGGTHAGGNGIETDIPAVWGPGVGSNRGALVDMAAPYDGWRLAGARWNGTEEKPYLVYESGSQAAGTSYSAPAVGAALGLHQALAPDLAINKTTEAITQASDDIQAITTGFRLWESGGVPRLNLFEVVFDGLSRSRSLPAHRRALRIYAVDDEDNVLVSQIVDPSTGQRESGTVVSRDLSEDGCVEPVDVVVHPLGDMVFVLCRDSQSISSYTATELDYVGTIALEGEVGPRTDLGVLASGLLNVATRSEGTMVLESFDTWTGTREAPTALLWEDFTSAEPVGMGVAVHPDGSSLALMLSDQSASSDDYDVLVHAHPDPDDSAKEAIQVTESLSTVTGTYTGRDLAWRADGSAALAVFYYGTGTDFELIQTDFDGETSGHTVSGDCDHLDAIAIDPTGNTDFAFVACRQLTGTTDRTVAVLDLSSAPTSFNPVTSIFANTGTGTTHRNIGVEVADNGRFVAILHEPRGSGNGYVRTLPMDTIKSAVVTSSDLDPSSMSSMSYAFSSPSGVAFSPTISIANPRPGTILRGARRLHIVLRQPQVSEVRVYVDEVLGCTDTKVASGFSRNCVVDTTEWTSGTHLVRVEVESDGGLEFSSTFPFEAE